MNKIILILFICFCSSFIFAQSSYDDAIQKGDQAYKKGAYKEAMNLYFAAEAFDPSKRKEVKQKIDLVFDKINDMKNQANTAKKRIENAYAKSKAAQEQTQKLIDALFFYEDKFSLTYQKGHFGYINKSGVFVIEPKYIEAEPFNTTTGLAKVKRRGQDYLIDTTKTEYRLVTKLGDFMGSNIEAFQAFEAPLEAADISQIINSKSATALKILSLRTNSNLVSLPENIDALSNLKVLSIWSNDLVTLPENIGKLKALESLILGLNKLYELPESIGSLSQLKKLSLEGNQLKKLPKNIGKLSNLEILYVFYNKFDEYPEEINQLSALKTLNIGKNEIKSIPQSIKGLTKLENLNLSYIKLTNFPTAVLALKNLKELRLDGNQIDQIPTTINRLNNLEILSLRKTKIPKSKRAEIEANVSSTCKIIWE